MSAYLMWSIKQSLLGYISSLEDGLITTKEPASELNQLFVFRASTDNGFDWESNTGVLQFEGSVLFTGYGGMMSVEIRNPMLTLEAGLGTLATEFGGSFGPAKSFDVASVKHISGNEYSATLVESGRAILGPQYQVGEVLDTFTIGPNFDSLESNL